MKSVMAPQFSQNASVKTQRSVFNLSHGHKTTFNAGELIPVLAQEILPGDTFNVRMNTFARLATPIAPIMDNMFLDSFFFFVPNRLIWDNWEKFCGAQDNPGDSIDFLVPQIEAPVGGYTARCIYDYLGLPTLIAGIKNNNLHGRAYNLIWNEWFRDQNLQDSIVVDTDAGPDAIADYCIKRRGKRHDYFTSCLPFPQKGDAVQIPLGDSAPIEYIPATGNAAQLRFVSTDALFGTNGPLVTDSNGDLCDANPAYNRAYLDPNGTLQADLSAATASTVNLFRQAFQIQKLLERDARGGTRYVETIKSHFGVTSPDFRLQRPEYLGGGTQPVNINPVTQTSETGTTPQGTMSAFGTTSGNNHGFTKSFTEHGVILGMVCVRADLNYQQGMDKMWSRQTRYDFFWPTLANIGEQAVLNQEIYTQGPTVVDGLGNPVDENVFGYQERFGEYRYARSKITGLYRSNYATSLDFWHLAQDFSALPELNDAFIQENPPIDRVIATPTEPHFLFDSYFNIKASRPMPARAVPGLIDHF